MTVLRTLEHDRERENPRPLDLHLDISFALPCLEAGFTAEHESIVDVSLANPNREEATTTETPNANWSIHLSMG